MKGSLKDLYDFVMAIDNRWTVMMYWPKCKVCRVPHAVSMLLDYFMQNDHNMPGEDLESEYCKLIKVSGDMVGDVGMEIWLNCDCQGKGFRYEHKKLVHELNKEFGIGACY
jgi:hypothetical protein